MTFTVSPIEDADHEPSLHVEHIAARSSGGIVLHMIPNEQMSAKELSTSLAKRREAVATNPHTHFLKVVDSSLGGQIIGIAQWDIYPNRLSDREFEQMCTMEEAPDETPKEAWDEFFGYLGRSRRRWLADRAPRACLFLLVVLPEYHRKGAGTMLLRWGLERADELGLEAYLEASMMGRPLYEKFGFQVVDTMRYDMEKYGKEGWDETVVMLRPKIGEEVKTDVKK